MRLVRESASEARDAGSPAKIALFSLGNLASHPECAAQLAALGISDVLASLAGRAGRGGGQVLRAHPGALIKPNSSISIPVDSRRRMTLGCSHISTQALVC